MGKIYPKQQEDAPVEIISGKKKNIVPEQLWKIKPSMIKGQKVYIGADRKEKTYHAAWEKAGTYYYASSDSLQEDEFLNYLKKNIESL